MAFNTPSDHARHHFSHDLWVTDQNGRELDLRGEELTLTFHIKAC